MQRPKSWSFPETKEDLSAFTNVLGKKNTATMSCFVILTFIIQRGY